MVLDNPKFALVALSFICIIAIEKEPLITNLIPK